jgi:autotransporter-associated beta strand protein
MKTKNVLIIVAIMLIAGKAQATAYTWDGHSTVSDNFSDENWTGVAPTTLASHAFTFGALSGPSRTMANNNLDGNPNTFTFNAEAAAMTITGNALQFAGDAATPIVNNSVNAQTFGAEVRQFWFITLDKKWNAASGNLNFSNVVLRADANANANVTLTIDGTYNTTISGAITKAGWGTGGPSLIKTNTGVLALSTNSNFDAVTVRGGTLRLTGGTLSTTKQTASTGLGVQLASGTLEVAGGNISVGTYGLGSYSASAGSLNVTSGNVAIAGGLIVGWNSGPTFTVSGGTLTAATIRHADAQNSVLTISGTGVVTAPNVYHGAGGGNTDSFTLNLNAGGTLVASNLYMTLSGTALTNGNHSLNVSFDGGTLKALGSGTLITTNPVVSGLSTRAINVKVKAGGAVFDTDGKTVSVLQPLLHDAGLGSTPDGGLTKNGAGTLTLSSTNTYSGPTTLNEGTLSLSQPNTSNDASIVTMASDATLNLTFTGTDTVKRLYIDGQQRGPGVFGAVGSASPIKGIPQITGTGTLTVLEGPGTLISFF